MWRGLPHAIGHCQRHDALSAAGMAADCAADVLAGCGHPAHQPSFGGFGALAKRTFASANPRRWADRLAHFLGEVWSRSVAFRCRETQVCPQCLYERGYCRGFWRLSTISACTVHARWLLDRCGACGRPIGWTRPAVDICQCKRALKSSGDDAAPELLLRWCDWVERRIVGAQVEAKSCGLPPWFDHLTVDGASSLVRLVGLRERAHERISAATAARPTDTAATAIQRARGLRRLLDLDPDGSESVRALSPYIHEGGLQLLARVGVGAADRRLADRWLTWVAGRTCTTPRAAGVPATGSSACSTDGFASFRAPR
jgi:hypothetical protein